MRVTVDATDLDSDIENGDWNTKLLNAIDEALNNMRDDPGAANKEITLEIVNDFEPEDENEESEDETTDETETKKEA